ncbi:MAG: ADP-ribosylglycohydrolase family protein [Verrucomicrobiota bacterium]
MIPYPDLIKAALTADALSLGPHWIYNQAELAKAYPDGVRFLTGPLSKYHPEKSAGDLTHYGDIVALMLLTVSEHGSWDSEIFVSRWKKFWSDTSSYQDGATRETLSHLEDPNLPTSTSNDIAGASIALALIGLIGSEDDSALIASVRGQTSFAHRDPETIDAAEFFTRVVLRLRSGDPLTKALDQAASADYGTLKAGHGLDKAKKSLTSASPLKAAADFGLSCHTPDAFPLVLYYLLRHPADIGAALSENASAGGDNAARAIIIAIVLTEANGWDAGLEELWLGVKQRPECEKALAS